MPLAGFIPGDVIASVSGATIVAVVWLARQLGRANERIAKLEGKLEQQRDDRY